MAVSSVAARTFNVLLPWIKHYDLSLLAGYVTGSHGCEQIVNRGKPNTAPSCPIIWPGEKR